MINLRYHIVSITAVFLALGIGLAIGSSFLSDFAIAGVEGNLDRAEADIRDTNAENGRLRDELDEVQVVDAALMEDGSPQLLRDRLDEVPVVVVTVEGADQDPLEALDDALVASGAEYEARLVLTGRNALEGDAAQDMAEVLGVDPPDSSDPATLQAELADQLAEVLLDAAAAPSLVAPPEGEDAGRAEPELISALRDGGFLDVVAPADGDGDAPVLNGRGYRFVVVSGMDADLADEALLLPLVRQLAADGPAPVVVASAATGDDPEAEREAVVGPIREDDDISGSVATVDDLERFAGVAATVLVLDRLDDEARGHFGTGDGASSVLPPATP